jgi:hypothetical protein
MAMQEAMEVCFIPCYISFASFPQNWLNGLAINSYNHGDVLGILARSYADWWQVGELYANYAILENNLVPENAGHL